MMNPDPSAVVSWPPRLRPCCWRKCLKNCSKGEPGGKSKGIISSDWSAASWWVDEMFTTAGVTRAARSAKVEGGRVWASAAPDSMTPAAIATPATNDLTAHAALSALGTDGLLRAQRIMSLDLHGRCRHPPP